MERSIETAINNGLERISLPLHMFSIGFGIVLVLVGGFFFLTKKGKDGETRKTRGALACMIFGAIAIISALIQMV